MIIEYNITSCDFVDLWVGDAFALYKGGEKYICMKINDGMEDDFGVYLATGEAFEIEPHQRVEKIKAKIVVE